MPRFGQRTFAFAVVLSLCALVLVPTGFAVESTHVSVARTGPTLPPQPWDGVAPTSKTGPTLPPQPWDGIV